MPRLLWRARLGEGRPVTVECGPGVERAGAAAFEGVWDGDFGAFDFAAADHVFGSGIVVGDDRVTIVPPGHMYEGIYVLLDRSEGRYFVSNSLAACIAMTPDRIREPAMAAAAGAHEANDRNTRNGVFAYNPVLLRGRDWLLVCLFHHNLVFERGRPPWLEFRAVRFRPESYDEYRSFIVDRLAKLFANGAHPARETKLTPIACISSGYDSPAGAAFGREAGCRETMTIDVAVGGRSDSGAEIAGLLGMECARCAHPLGAEIEDLNRELGPEVLERATPFLATTGLGDDLMLLAFDDMVENRIMLWGALGDPLWDKRSVLRSGLPVMFPYVKSAGEYRIAKGYAQIPVPVLGAQFPAAIRRLSVLPEMKPWTVGGRYDRPLARRAIEEAGVPRGTFAVRKNATNPHAPNFAAHKPAAFRRMVERYANAGAGAKQA